jgi:hypothetical protein
LLPSAKRSFRAEVSAKRMEKLVIEALFVRWSSFARGKKRMR